MHFIHSDFRIKKKWRNQIEFEVSSGRYYILFIAVFVLLFQVSWILIPGLVIVLFTWSYERCWVVDYNDQRLRSISRILWMTYNDETFTRSEMVDIVVRIVRDGEYGAKCAVATLRLKGKPDQQLFAYPNVHRVMEFVTKISDSFALEVVRELTPLY